MSIVWFSLHCLPYFARTLNTTQTSWNVCAFFDFDMLAVPVLGILDFIAMAHWKCPRKIIILIELTFGKQPRLVFFFLSRKHLKCEMFNNQDWIPNWFIDDDWLSFVVFKSQFAFIDHVKCILCRRSKFYMHLRRLNRRCGITFFVRKWWIFGFWKENR